MACTKEVFMKKIITLFLTFLIICSLPGNCLYADTESLTEQNAKELFERACDMFFLFDMVFHDDKIGIVLDPSDKKDNIEKPISGSVNAEDLYHYRVKSIKFYDGKEYVINNKTDLESFIASAFSNDVTASFLDKYMSEPGTRPYSEYVKSSFYIDDNSIVYHVRAGFEGQLYQSYGVESVENIKVTGDTATAEMLLQRSQGVPLSEEYMRIPMTFKKEADGWRISSDIFLDVLYARSGDRLDGPYKQYVIDNPSTGDNTAPLVLAAFASLLPLAWFGLRRKRAA